MKEIWKDIKGYNGLYQVSNFGNIFSKIRNRQLKHYSDKNGYKRTALTLSKKTKQYYIHRLVGKSFVLNPENKPFINHLDFNRSNNRVENIEWNTHNENIQYSKLYGKFKMSEERKEQQRQLNTGENCNWSKLKNIDIPKIRQLKLARLTNTQIGNMFNVNRRTIEGVLNNLTWKHII